MCSPFLLSKEVNPAEMQTQAARLASLQACWQPAIYTKQQAPTSRTNFIHGSLYSQTMATEVFGAEPQRLGIKAQIPLTQTERASHPANEVIFNTRVLQALMGAHEILGSGDQMGRFATETLCPLIRCARAQELAWQTPSCCWPRAIQQGLILTDET